MAKLWKSKNDALESIKNDNPFFGNLLTEAFGGSWRNSSEREDMVEHIDIFYSPSGGQEYGIDIKTMSKIQRSDSVPNPNYQYIQVTTKIGTNGALYGHAKYFGFINTNGHLLTSLEYVRLFYENVVDKKIVYKNPRKENILYQRRYRNSDGELVCPPEKIFMMRYIDLKCLSDYTFDKEGKPVLLPAGEYGRSWVDFYINRIKEEIRKMSWGSFDTLYSEPNKILTEFRKTINESNG